MSCNFVWGKGTYANQVDSGTCHLLDMLQTSYQDSYTISEYIPTYMHDYRSNHLVNFSNATVGIMVLLQSENQQQIIQEHSIQNCPTYPQNLLPACCWLNLSAYAKPNHYPPARLVLMREQNIWAVLNGSNVVCETTYIPG